MNDFLTTLLQAVLTAAVPVCAAYASLGFKAMLGYFKEKTNNDFVKKYLSAAGEAVHTAVTYTSQVYVGKLKESGRFTKENQQEALELAVSQAKSLLTAQAAQYLKEAYGDLDEFLKSKIEAEVFWQKRTAVALALNGETEEA